MKTTYVFSDWTSIPRMKNYKNPNLAIDVAIIIDNQNNKSDGYQVTIHDIATLEIIYRFYIDSDKYEWSLTTDEAIKILNSLGFACQYLPRVYEISEAVKTTLQSLNNLGYSHIYKEFDPQNSIVACIFDLDKSARPFSCIEIARIAPVGYNYTDYSFIQDHTPIKIADILNNCKIV